MVDYPIYVPRSNYRGRDPRKQRKAQQHDALAARLEQYINARSADSDMETRQFAYRSLAARLQVSEDAVRKVLFLVDGGRNSVTVRKYT